MTALMVQIGPLTERCQEIIDRFGMREVENGFVVVPSVGLMMVDREVSYEMVHPYWTNLAKRLVWDRLERGEVFGPEVEVVIKATGSDGSRLVGKLWAGGAVVERASMEWAERTGVQYLQVRGNAVRPYHSEGGASRLDVFCGRLKDRNEKWALAAHPYYWVRRHQSSMIQGVAVELPTLVQYAGVIRMRPAWLHFAGLDGGEGSVEWIRKEEMVGRWVAFNKEARRLAKENRRAA